MNKKYLLLFSFVTLLTNAIWGQSVTELLRTANNKILFKNYKEALASLNKLVTVEKSNEIASKVYHLRGRAYAGLKMQKDALSDFNTAIQLDPNNVEAYNYKGIIFLEQEKPEEALVSFNTAIEKNVTYADAFLNRSKSLFKLNRHKDAL